MQVSVVICTHSPREDYLTRSLESLRRQTLPMSEWEIIVIDNASKPPLPASLVAWHPNGRVVCEGRLGLTNARLRGIRETTAPLIVFVDDDNVLEENYLSETVAIEKSNRFLGAWGGAVLAEYEVPPPEWVEKRSGMLAIRECRQVSWSNEPYGSRSTPVGAGMSVRRQVAEKFASDLASKPHGGLLGRKGNDLMGCEDTEMAHASFHFGWGVGMFPQLRLTHLIPAQRLTLEYFERLSEGTAASGVLMKSLRGDAASHPTQMGFARCVHWWMCVLRSSRAERRIMLAGLRGHRRAQAMVKTMTAEPPVDGAAAGRP